MLRAARDAAYPRIGTYWKSVLQSATKRPQAKTMDRLLSDLPVTGLRIDTACEDRRTRLNAGINRKVAGKLYGDSVSSINIGPMIFALEMERFAPEWHGSQPRQAFRRAGIGFAPQGINMPRALASGENPQNRRSFEFH